MSKKIQIIVNPAAGQATPVLSILNDAFKDTEWEWDILLTKAAGDAQRLAREAAEAGADLVAAYGGDGTVMEVASGLSGCDVPMAIFPGGTANVMSVELDIPFDLAEAVKVALAPDSQRVAIDMGRYVEGDMPFILRMGIGLEAEMVEKADRTLKDRFGSLAYALSALQALRDPQVSRYRMVLDGVEVEAEGFSCLICNSANLGRPGMSLSPKTSVRDGLLDVFVLTSTALPSLLQLAASVVGSGEVVGANLQQWQAREIHLVAEPNQVVQLDGEVQGETPLTVSVIPAAVEIIVPAGALVLQTPPAAVTTEAEGATPAPVAAIGRPAPDAPLQGPQGDGALAPTS